jgi:hypothetical protein
MIRALVARMIVLSNAPAYMRLSLRRFVDAERLRDLAARAERPDFKRWLRAYAYSLELEADYYARRATACIFGEPSREASN